MLSQAMPIGLQLARQPRSDGGLIAAHLDASVAEIHRDATCFSNPGRIALKKAFFMRLMTVCHVLV